MCKILHKWMSINFYFSSWCHCKSHAVDSRLTSQMSVLALERGSAVARHQSVGAQQKCLLLARELLVLICTDRVGALSCSCHLLNQWMLGMRCTVSHSSEWQVLCRTDTSGIKTLTPILAWSQVSCTQGHSLTMNSKS